MFRFCRTIARSGSLNVGRFRDSAFTPEDVELLTQVAQQIAIAVENSLAYREIAELKEKLSEEKLYLEEEIRTTYNFDEIVGESAQLKRALQQVEIVAPTDSTVLIQGETGTGKELIARAIHHLSARRARTFVKLNCAAIPTGLLESELFGHEKGAFTGAIAQKIGRFELANGGTLFLDEVGDIPLELQSKFLRVLQEQEFERLGGTRTIRVDVRLVAATNRDLPAMVAEQRIPQRSLLSAQRLSHRQPAAARPAPKTSPAWCALRAEVCQTDEPVDHGHSSRDDGRTVAVSLAWQHSGAREFHRACGDPVARLDAGRAARRAQTARRSLMAPEETRPLSTLDEAEREHICRALEEANWRVGGASGAAARLGMKRTTLQSKMAKLGIARPAL